MICFTATEAKSVRARALNGWNDGIQLTWEDVTFEGVGAVGGGTPAEGSGIVDVGTVQEGSVAVVRDG